RLRQGDQPAIVSPRPEEGSWDGLLDTLQDVQNALALAGETVAQLAGHGDGGCVEGGEAAEEMRERCRQIVRLTPQREGEAAGETVAVGCLEVGAADIEA